MKSPSADGTLRERFARHTRLQAACERLLEQADDNLISAFGRENVAPILTTLMEALERSDGDAPRFGGDGAKLGGDRAGLGGLATEPRDASVLRQLIGRVRRELLREPDAAAGRNGALAQADADADAGRNSSRARPDAETTLELLRKLERVQAALEADPEQRVVPGLFDRSALEVITDVAHDLRSPLTTVLFLSETLWRGQSGSLNDTQHRQLGLIYSAALGLISLLGDMLEFAQGGKALRDVEPLPLSVTEVLDSVRNIVQPMAEEKGLKLRFLSPETDHRMGYGSPLSRILLNLTTNALKFTHEGFVEIVARETGGSSVEFSVRDSGPGIHPDAELTLFQPFRSSRARESGYYFSGTGLGLTIARRLVKALGDELRYETGADWGTRFYFEINMPPAPHTMRSPGA